MKWCLFVYALLSVVLVPGPALAGPGETPEVKPVQTKSAGRSNDDRAECPDTDKKFREDAGSAEDEIRRLMADLRKKKPQLKGMSLEERTKVQQGKMRHLADLIDANLRRNGLWDTDAGRQGMGMSSFLRGDYDAAIALFTKVLQTTKNPNVKTWILEDRGEAYFAKGDKVNALGDLDAAINIKAEDKSSNLAQLAWNLGRTDDAKRELEINNAYQRTKKPGFVAESEACANLEAIGKPASGCITSDISECFRFYGKEGFDNSVCGKYAAEMKYLQASRFPASTAGQ